MRLDGGRLRDDRRTRCGSTRAVVCAPCADRNRRLRMQQCREGWHLDTEPEAGQDVPAYGEMVEPDRDASERVDSGRRVRSTRRRQDAPDLPCVPVESRTIGRVFEAGDGRRFRPSMFATFTLPSYWRVRADGTPVDRDRYDYRRQVLDAMHFPKLVDWLWQNLRRATGYRVQYFAAAEPQRRLAPHLHAAIRGAIPRQVFREVVAATYHQVWWPAFDQPIFTDQLPVWSGDEVGYVDPNIGVPLRTWDEALDALLDEALERTWPDSRGSRRDYMGTPVRVGSARPRPLGPCTRPSRPALVGLGSHSARPCRRRGSERLAVRPVDARRPGHPRRCRGCHDAPADRRGRDIPRSSDHDSADRGAPTRPRAAEPQTPSPSGQRPARSDRTSRQPSSSAPSRLLPSRPAGQRPSRTENSSTVGWRSGASSKPGRRLSHHRTTPANSHRSVPDEQQCRSPDRSASPPDLRRAEHAAKW
jgi:hypothetical protein